MNVRNDNKAKRHLRWLGTLVCLVMTLAVPPGARAQPPSPVPPPEHFTRWPAIERVAMSPSGQHLALLMYTDGLKRRALAVLPLATPKEGAKIIVSYADADISSVQWVNDRRLVYEANMQGPELRDGEAATFAANLDGSDERRLIEWSDTTDASFSHIKNRVLPYGWFLHGTVEDGSNDILVRRRRLDSNGEHIGNILSRLDTTTGELKNLRTEIAANAFDFLTDAKGEPVLVEAGGKGRSQVHLREADGRWTLLQDVAHFSDGGRFSDPLFVDGKGKVLVTARLGRDHTALHEYDPAQQRVEPEPLIAVKGFDVRGWAAWEYGTRDLIGLHFTADRPLSVWFHPRMQALQATVDAALPKGRTNVLVCRRCIDARFVVVHSRSDRHPGEYHLVDRQAGSVQRLTTQRPWIVEEQQGRRTLHRVTTRDGLEMPVVVTHPPGSRPDQPLPTVMLVHGGPYLRGTDTLWEGEAQFLASRGYRVVEPEFRGSTGYGWKLFQGGWKQWGRAMQDDLVDALDWASQQKLSDPKRVCIMGSSYGGYASLMGPVRHPDTYRCAISFAGVSDIAHLMTSRNSDMSEEAREYGMKTLLGDPQQEAERWRDVSPVVQAAKIRVPVLLAHGKYDRRVPIEHADAFVAAAKRAGVELDYVRYDRVGHGWHHADDHTDFLRRVEAFLAKSLKRDEPR